MKRHVSTMGGVAAVVLALAATVRADVAPDPLLTGGTSVSPMLPGGQPCTVEMVAEEVDLHPSAKLNRVTARFVLKNTGDADAEFEVGFPSYFKMPLQDFKVEVDGKPQPAELKKTGGEGRKKIFTYWMCWPMSFPRGAERVVVVTYAVETERVFPELHIDKLPPDLKDQVWRRSSGYVLRTGAAWAGKIGRAVIRLHYGDECRREQVTLRRPDRGWKYDAAADTDTLVLADFEPTEEWDRDGRNAWDIHYEWRALAPAQEFDALYAALEQKRIDPWAMEYLLDLAGKQNVRKLDAAGRAALTRDILERMLPPFGPDRYAHELSAGAEHVLVKAHRTLSLAYAAGGETEKADALDAAFRKLRADVAADRARRKAEAEAARRAATPAP